MPDPGGCGSDNSRLIFDKKFYRKRSSFGSDPDELRFLHFSYYVRYIQAVFFFRHIGYHRIPTTKLHRENTPAVRRLATSRK